MGIAYESHEPFAKETARGEPCFFCRRPLLFPTIYWLGAGGTIHLHPSCAVEFSIRLLRDVHEIETQTNRKITIPPEEEWGWKGGEK